ncbi:MAG: NAD-dependent epimerase/dehydratase family protein [Alphaproteobacteria bacterium]|nr:NAD-dependent epimerase/dehydratase family protein [Alphaproteobacteria bacterium]
MQIKGGRFLLTGGASLIGSHLAQQLLDAEAAEVILFDNYSLGSPDVAAFLAQDRRVNAVRGDITRLYELYDALDGVNGVFALAGFLTLPLSQNPGLGLDVNVHGMFNIVEACRHRGVRKVVFSSSVAVYGDPEADEVDEAVPFRWQSAPPALALYASSKIIGENLLRLYKQRYGLDYVALRYSTVYGERQHHRGVNALHIIESYERIKRGERPILPGDGSEGHDYIYVGDVARANLMAMASEVSGESFLIATGADTSLNDIAGILLRLTGSSLKPEYRDDPGKVQTTTRAALNYRPRKARQMLGWEARVGVEDGIRRLIAWAEGANAP